MVQRFRIFGERQARPQLRHAPHQRVQPRAQAAAAPRFTEMACAPIFASQVRPSDGTSRSSRKLPDRHLDTQTRSLPHLNFYLACATSLILLPVRNRPRFHHRCLSAVGPTLMPVPSLSKASITCLAQGVSPKRCLRFCGCVGGPSRELFSVYSLRRVLEVSDHR
jgi:hypothetical protein